MKATALLLASLFCLPALCEAQVYGPRVTAVIMLTSGESASCAFGNINVAWVVIVRKAADSTRVSRRYVTSLDGCAMIPIKSPIGTRIQISGIMQDRGAINGLSPSLPTVNEGCFNTEAYSVGLKDGGSGELDPTDVSNIIDPKGYGLFWDQQDLAAAMSETFVVTGCPSGGCQRPNMKFNTDTGYATNDCVTLYPIDQ